MEAIWYVIGVGGVVAILVWAFATIKGNGQANANAQAEIIKISTEKAQIESELNQLRYNYHELEKEVQTLRILKNENAILNSKYDDQKNNYFDLKNKIEVLENKYNHLQSEKENKVSELTRLSTLLENEKNQIIQIQTEKTNLIIKLEDCNNQLEELKQEKAAWLATREKQEELVMEKLQQLTAVYQEHKDEKDRIRKEAHEQQQELIRQRDQEWRSHELKVKEEFKQIANRCGAEIPQSYPFQGEPDNCILIRGEYVIFDAKAPKNSDRPENLEKYLNEQIKKISKYTDEPLVRKESFLVIPDSALPFITNFYKERDGNKVYIIPLSALEPIIRNMKLIENYHLAEQLSPESREDIVQFIGKSSYVMKKKIQVDQAFSHKFFEILDEAKNLPEDILTPAQEKETTLSMSLPVDRFNKVIKETELRKKSSNLDHQLDEEDIPPLLFDQIEKKAS